MVYKRLWRARVRPVKKQYRQWRSIPRSPSFVVSRTVAAINNVQANQAAVQAVLAAHFPGAATGWQTVCYEVITGPGLMAMLQGAYTVPQTSEISGMVVKSKSEQSLNLVLAYRQVQGQPYRIVTGTGAVRAYFRFREGTNAVQAPNHIILISEGTATFRFKFYLKMAMARSVI